MGYEIGIATEEQAKDGHTPGEVYVVPPPKVDPQNAADIELAIKTAELAGNRIKLFLKGELR